MSSNPALPLVLLRPGLVAQNQPGAEQYNPALEGTSVAIAVHAYPPVSVNKPPGALDFIQYGTNTGASAAAPTLIAAGLSYEVPNGQTAFVRSLTLQCLNVAPTSDVYFSLFVAGAAVVGWNELYVLPGTIPVWSESWGPEETTIQVTGPKTIELRVAVNDGGSYQVSGQYHGWMVDTPIAQADAAGWK